MGGNKMNKFGLILPASFRSIDYNEVHRDWALRLHKQTAFELVYCISGRISVWINHTEYQLMGGDVVLLKPGVYHSGHFQDHTVIFSFDFDLEPGHIRSFLMNLKQPSITGGELASDRNAMEWMDKLLSFVTDDSQKSRDRVQNHTRGLHSHVQSVKFQSYFLSFLTEIVERFLQEQETRDAMASELQAKQLVASEVANYIEMHGGDGIQIGYIADKLNFHRNYITRCFTQVYGITPQQYAMRIRIEKAKRLLQQSELSITEISDNLSFSTSAAFSRFFRSYTGNTPSQFRRGIN